MSYGKKRKETKAEELIRKGAGVSCKRPKRKILKISCAEIPKHLEPLRWTESIVEEELLKRIKSHVKDCRNDSCESVRFLLFPKLKKTHCDL